MYQVEYDRLVSFTKEYEWIINHLPVIQQNGFSIEQEAIMKISIIDFCSICEQDTKSPAYWNNRQIDNFIENHQNLYQTMKTFRDSYLAHIDHSKIKEERIRQTLQNLNYIFSNDLYNFYLLCKNLIKSA